MFYLDLFQTLQDEKVDYLLIGGLALNIHGVERATMDIDLLLALDEQNLTRFLRVAERLKLVPQLPVPLAQFADPVMRKEWVEQRHLIAFALRPPLAHAPTVDLLLKSPLDFRAAHARRLIGNLGAVSVSVAAIDDLIALKSGTGREHDASDIAALRRLRGLGLGQ